MRRSPRWSAVPVAILIPACVATHEVERRSDGGLSFEVQSNLCPELTTFSAAPLQTGQGDWIELRAAASDADGGPLSFSWRVDSAGTPGHFELGDLIPRSAWKVSEGIARGGAAGADDSQPPLRPATRTVQQHFVCGIGEQTLEVTVRDDAECSVTRTIDVTCVRD